MGGDGADMRQVPDHVADAGQRLQHGHTPRLRHAAPPACARLGQAPAEQQKEPAAHRHGGERAGRGERPELDQDRGEQPDPQRLRIAPQAAAQRHEPGESQRGEQCQAGKPALVQRLGIEVVRMLGADPGAAAVRLPAVERGAEVARHRAAGAKSVEAATGHRVLLADLQRAGIQLAVLAGGEMVHLVGELQHQPMVGRRRDDDGGRDQRRARDAGHQHHGPQLPQQQCRDEQAEPGQQHRHALADQHHHEHRRQAAVRTRPASRRDPGVPATPRRAG